MTTIKLKNTNQSDPEPAPADERPNDGASDAGAPGDVNGDNPYTNEQNGGALQEASTSGRKHAKRDESWEARRRFNNMRRREKSKAAHRARVAAAREAQEALTASMTPDQLAEWQAAQAAERAARAAAEAVQAERVAAALAGGGQGRGPDATLRIAIDCSFTPSAPPKEMRSLCKQIENASSLNKRHPRPACLTLTNWGEPLASVAEPSGAGGWRVIKLREGPVEAFGADRVVVLSPDAPEPLLEVDALHAYVIGGIVDRTHRKGLTLQFAESQRVDCRRLPVAEHAEPLGLGKGTRKCPVLNIDDVVRALLVYHDTHDWVAALDAAIPARKRKPQTQGFTKPAGDAAALATGTTPPQPPQGPEGQEPAFEAGGSVAGSGCAAAGIGPGGGGEEGEQEGSYEEEEDEEEVESCGEALSGEGEARREDDAASAAGAAADLGGLSLRDVGGSGGPRDRVPVSSAAVRAEG